MKYKEAFGYLCAFLAAMSYALMTTFVKLAKDVPFETLVFVRTFLCLLLTLPHLSKIKFTIKTKKLPYHAIRAFAGFFSLFLLFYAAKRLYLVDVLLLANTAPLFIPIIVLVWMKSKIPTNRLIAIGVGFIGVIVLIKPSCAFFNLAGLAALSGGFLIAIADVSIKRMAKTEHPQLIMFYFFLVSAVSSIGPMIFSWKRIDNPLTWGIILLVGIFGYLFQFFITRAYIHAPVTKASPVAFIAILLGAIIGWIWWGEALYLHHLIGSILVIGGSLYIILSKGSSKHKKNLLISNTNKSP
jgi:drug/metabolite transporter (DMT)-like permease